MRQSCKSQTGLSTGTISGAAGKASEGFSHYLTQFAQEGFRFSGGSVKSRKSRWTNRWDIILPSGKRVVVAMDVSLGEVNVGSAFWPYGAQEPAHIDAEPVFSDERWSIEHTNIPDQILQALKRALNQAFRAADYPQTSP